MLATTGVERGIPCKENLCVPLQISTLPARQLKIRQLSNFPSTTRGGLTASSTNSSKNMAVITNPAETMSSEESTSVTKVKWSGGVHLVLNCNLDAAWSLQADFLGLCKWVPNISICRLDEGEENEVGCLRYCKGSNGTWVHERLLEFDDANHYMSYRMEDNHFVFPQGVQGYVAKVQLGDAGEDKTSVKWTYEVDPVATQTKESITTFMAGFYALNLQHLETGANKLVTESNLKASGNPNLSASQAPAASVQG